MDDIKKAVQPVMDVFSDGPMKIIPNLMKCSNLMEFSGCAALSIIGHNSSGMNGAIIFAVLYVVWGNQLGVRLRANPALSFADFMRGQNGSGCDVFHQVMFQIFGYAFGFWLSGLIGLTEHKMSAAAGADFSTLLFNEVLSVAVLAWLWMHIHDDDCNSGWKDFMGLAVGLALWLAGQMSIGSAHMNGAVHAGEDFGRTIGFWRDGAWALNDWAQFFAPIISAFLTSLVYTHFRK